MHYADSLQSACMDRKYKLKVAIAQNVARCLEESGLRPNSATDLESHTGLPKRTGRDVLVPDARPATLPSLETLEVIARGFQLPGAWALQLAPDEIGPQDRLREATQIMDDYLHCDSNGRRLVRDLAKQLRGKSQG